MNARHPEFEIAAADQLHIGDAEISALLTQVYVEAGFTTPDEALSLFEPGAVRRRGFLIAARERGHSQLSGMIIVVPPDSPARKLAQHNEAELHLLGVKPEYRGQGLGRRLVQTALQQATHMGYTKVILWTQLIMHPAQRLYESMGFLHVDTFERNKRAFKVYECRLSGEFSPWKTE